MSAALVAAALWLGVAIHLARLRGRAPGLPAPSAAAPPTTIVLPVRDEEENVEPCVESLLAQEGAPAVLVVDDGSTDATPRLLDGLAAAAARLRLLAARPLPAGWSGKVNALATAFEIVETDWVLFTDADTRHSPELLAHAHAAIAEHRLDALSLAGREEARGVGENLITPTVFALLDLLLGDWAPHARGAGLPPVANGQYFLIRSTALRSIGGLASIAGRQLDDVALARALSDAGFRVGFRRAGDALRIRMYEGLGASFAGWRRNLALFFGERPKVPVAVALLAVATLGAWTTAALDARPIAALLALWTAGVASSAIARKSSGNDPLFALLFPLDLLALAGLLATSVFDRRRGRLAAWKGRESRI